MFLIYLIVDFARARTFKLSVRPRRTRIAIDKWSVNSRMQFFFSPTAVETFLGKREHLAVSKKLLLSNILPFASANNGGYELLILELNLEMEASRKNLWILKVISSY